MDVTAELTASVWKITVAPGDEVVPGSTLMILESMKMEIPVLAPVGGKVASIAVAEGDTVAEGQQLASIETAAS
jgi:acetyl-CoA carboxylase biotin carboxyl carrier protein